MHAWTRDTIVRLPRSDAVAAWLLIATLALLAAMCSGCGCTTYYRWDGSSGPGARPYYAVEVCKNKPARVKCDSAEKLPNDDCK